MSLGTGLVTTSSRAIIGTFYETLAQATGASWVSRIAMHFDSNMPIETYAWLGASPVVREWLGERLHSSLVANNMTIANKTFEATLEVLVDDLRRDKTGQILIRIQEMADRVQAHWASLLSTIINNGAGSTNGLSYDGQYFFDTDHAEGSSGTLKNALTSSEVAALDVATATAPTASEMAQIIMGMISYFFNFKDDKGEPYNETANSFLVMVPVNMFGAAMTAVRANLLNTGSGSYDNPLKESGFTIDVAANVRLTSTSKMYVFRTDARTKPFIMQEEQGLSISALAEGSEEEFKRNRHLYGVKTIRNVGYGMWQHALQGTLS